MSKMSIINANSQDEYGSYGYYVKSKDITNYIDNFSNYYHEILDLEKLKKYLDENVVDNYDLEYLEHMEIIRYNPEKIKDFDGEVLNSYDWEIQDLWYFPIDKIYTYWDGSNWKDILIHEDSTIVEVDEKNITFINLDEWNGRNWETCQTGFHIKVGKFDGNYLAIETSDYQGTLEIARIFTKDELKNYLTECDREKYYDLLLNKT